MNEENEKKIVAIYTRVSTEDQARDGYSLDMQLKRIKEHCKIYDYEIYKVYEEPGISANGVRIDIWTHFMRECIINYVH